MALPRNRPKNTPDDPLDRLIHDFGNGDYLALRMLLEGAFVTGQSGGGKSSAFETIARLLLKTYCSIVVLCAKPEERKLWVEYARKTGREQDLRIMTLDGKLRFNFFDYWINQPGGAQVENIVQQFVVARELAEGKIEETSGESFWPRAQNQLIRASVTIFRLANETLTVDALCRFVLSAPQSKEEADSPAWLERAYFAQLFRRAVARLERQEASDSDRRDLEVAGEYFLRELVELDPRTKSNIIITLSSLADILRYGMVRELLCTETTIMPEDLYQGERGIILVLDIPVQLHHHAARFVQTMMKVAIQRQILGRDVERYPRPVAIWGDECQNFVSSSDYAAMAVSRSARLIHIYLTQNTHNLVSVLKNQSEVSALVANLNNKFFMANGDIETNKFASDTIGQAFVRTNSSGWNLSEQGSGQNFGEGEQMAYKVPPEAFHLLKTGGPLNDFWVQSVYFRAGHVFNATGQPWRFVYFKQFRKEE